MSFAITQAPVRNGSFYMDISIFQVENELFRIPTGYLKKYSAIFNQMFTLNPQPGAEAEGQSDERPIKLNGVSKVDFKRFLEVVVKYSRVEPTKTFGTAHWLSVLKLANLWGLSDLRQTAITKVSSSEPRGVFTAIEQLCYGRLHKVEQWVEQGYSELVDRREKISEADAKYIGWETSLKLCHLREDHHGPLKSFHAFGAPPQPPFPPAVTRAVRQEFSAELQEIREAGAALSVPAPRAIASLASVHHTTLVAFNWNRNQKGGMYPNT